MKNAVIMAGGKGTRMHSELPKVLHTINGETMIKRDYDSIKKSGAERIVIIVGYRHELVEKEMEGLCEFAVQEPQLGTGHAVMQARQLKGEKGLTLVANGDCPCVRPSTYAALYKECEDADMVILTAELPEERPYGRVIRTDKGTVAKIVEYKDATDKEKEVREVNMGIYCFNNESLWEGLALLKNDNAQQEYYITDLVEILNGLGKTVKALTASDWQEVQGCNDQKELKMAEKYLQERTDND